MTCSHRIKQVMTEARNLLESELNLLRHPRPILEPIVTSIQNAPMRRSPTSLRSSQSLEYVDAEIVRGGDHVSAGSSAMQVSPVVTFNGAASPEPPPRSESSLSGPGPVPSRSSSVPGFRSLLRAGLSAFQREKQGLTISNFDIKMEIERQAKRIPGCFDLEDDEDDVSFPSSYDALLSY